MSMDQPDHFGQRDECDKRILLQHGYVSARGRFHSVSDRLLLQCPYFQFFPHQFPIFYTPKIARRAFAISAR